MKPLYRSITDFRRSGPGIALPGARSAWVCITWLTLLLSAASAVSACGSLSRANPNSDELSMNHPSSSQFPPDAVVRRDQNGVVYYLKGENLSASLEADPGFRRLQAENNLEAVALAFLSAHGELLGLDRPETEMTLMSIDTDDLGLSHVKFKQVFAGIPVWGSEMMVHLDRENRVYLAQGRHIPTPSQVKLEPGITSEGAEKVVAGDLGPAGSECPRCWTERVIFAPEGGMPRLAYRVVTSIRPDEGWIYFIDAENGRILEKLSTVRTGG